MTSAHMENWRN